MFAFYIISGILLSLVGRLIRVAAVPRCVRNANDNTTALSILQRYEQHNMSFQVVTCLALIIVSIIFKDYDRIITVILYVSVIIFIASIITRIIIIVVTLNDFQNWDMYRERPGVMTDIPSQFVQSIRSANLQLTKQDMNEENTPLPVSRTHFIMTFVAYATMAQSIMNPTLLFIDASPILLEGPKHVSMLFLIISSSAALSSIITIVCLGVLSSYMEDVLVDVFTVSASAMLITISCLEWNAKNGLLIIVFAMSARTLLCIITNVTLNKLVRHRRKSKSLRDMYVYAECVNIVLAMTWGIGCAIVFVRFPHLNVFYTIVAIIVSISTIYRILSPFIHITPSDFPHMFSYYTRHHNPNTGTMYPCSLTKP